MRIALATLLLGWLILTVLLGLQLPFFLLASFVCLVFGIIVTLGTGGIFRIMDTPGLAVLCFVCIDWLLAIITFSPRTSEAIVQYGAAGVLLLGIMFGSLAGWASVVLCRSGPQRWK